jgi:hypothetical protein
LELFKVINFLSSIARLKRILSISRRELPHEKWALNEGFLDGAVEEAAVEAVFQVGLRHVHRRPPNRIHFDKRAS